MSRREHTDSTLPDVTLEEDVVVVDVLTAAKATHHLSIVLHHLYHLTHRYTHTKTHITICCDEIGHGSGVRVRVTLWGAVCEERNQERNVVDVLQMRTNILYPSRKLGLQTHYITQCL